MRPGKLGEMTVSLRTAGTVAAVMWLLTSVGLISMAGRASEWLLRSEISRCPLRISTKIFTTITFVKESGLTVDYEMTAPDGSSHTVVCIFDDDGIWRIKFV